MKRYIYTISISLLSLMMLCSCDMDTGNQDNPVSIAISSISITGTGISNGVITVAKGSTVQLSATVYPENTSDIEVSWISENDGIATVSESGLVTAVAEGTVIVKVVSKKDASISATITVKVAGTVGINTTPVDQSLAESRG